MDKMIKLLIDVDFYESAGKKFMITENNILKCNEVSQFIISELEASGETTFTSLIEKIQNNYTELPEDFEREIEQFLDSLGELAVISMRKL